MQRFARYAAWPLVVGVSGAGFALGFAAGQVILTLAAVPLLAWALILVFEAWIPLETQPPAWRDPQLGHDLFHTVIGQGFGNQLGAALVAGFLALGAGWAGERWGAGLWPGDWPLLAQIALVVVVADGLDYARHRAEHRWPLLWRVHALHHSVDRMHVLKSGRGHFLDMVLRHLLGFLPLAAIGCPPEILLWYVAAVTIFGPIGHSNVDVRLPAFVHRLVMTPQVHRIHHARAQTLSHSNFCNALPIWDVLFGTFEDPSRVVPDGFGVEGDTMPASLWGQLAAPFAWRRLTGARESEAAVV